MSQIDLSTRTNINKRMNNEDKISKEDEFINRVFKERSKFFDLDDGTSLLEPRPCAKCTKPVTILSVQKCSYCYHGWYCSKKCEIEHMPVHGADCQETVDFNNFVRYLMRIEIMLRNKDTRITSLSSKALKNAFTFPTILNSYYTEQYAKIGDIAKRQTITGDKQP